MKIIERNINYVCRKFTTSIPLEIAKMLEVEKGDKLQYCIHDDGTITISRGEKGDK